MADGNTGPRFQIRKIDPSEAPGRPPGNGAPPPTPPAATPPSPPSGSSTPPPARTGRPAAASGDGTKKKPDKPRKTAPPAWGDATGALFTSAGAVLAFLSSIAADALLDTSPVRRSPDSDWWVSLDIPRERTAALARAVGGHPYAELNGRWYPIFGDGPPAVAPPQSESIDVAAWPAVAGPDLLGRAVLSTCRVRAATVLDVVTPGALARWIIRRAASLGLDVSILPAEGRRLGRNKGVAESVLIVRITSPAGPVPAALVHGLGSLPYVLIGDASPFDSDRRLLIDVRRRLPVPRDTLLGLCPAGEIVALGPRDIGHWRLRRTGRPIDGVDLLTVPALEDAGGPPLSAASLPAASPVRITSRIDAPRRVDAVLLDETELNWLRIFASGRPIDETAFLFAGQGHCLLTAPGGLASAVPFGRPLTRIGPGGLYVELGKGFTPPLPEDARHHRFGLTPDTATVVLEEGAYRFPVEGMTPLWSLWVGEVPPVTEVMPRETNTILSALARSIHVAQAEAAPLTPTRAATAPADPAARARLVEEAQRFELAGDLVRAAERLEQAGYHAHAGRMFERAAGG
ncbi:MAG: hypothetical protein ACLQVD_17480 [Capsulimonadaceae bacterium]